MSKRVCTKHEHLLVPHIATWMIRAMARKKRKKRKKLS